MPKVKQEKTNPEALDTLYYLTRRNVIVNMYDRGELEEIRACELLSYLKFAEYTNSLRQRENNKNMFYAQTNHALPLANICHTKQQIHQYRHWEHLKVAHR